jgi:hypothetical protein
MVLTYKKNLSLALLVLTTTQLMAVSLNSIQQVVAQSPVDPVAMVHGQLPRKMTDLVSYGAIVAACVPTVVSLYKILRKQEGEKPNLVLPVGLTSGQTELDSTRYGVRFGYFGVNAHIPKEAGILEKMCRTSVSVDGVTPGNVAASMLAAYAAKQVLGSR